VQVHKPAREQVLRTQAGLVSRELLPVKGPEQGQAHKELHRPARMPRKQRRQAQATKQPQVLKVRAKVPQALRDKAPQADKLALLPASLP
jgi:hypothetical protein